MSSNVEEGLTDSRFLPLLLPVDNDAVIKSARKNADQDDDDDSNDSL